MRDPNRPAVQYTDDRNLQVRLGQVSEAFGSANVQPMDNALEFPSAEPVLDYFDSLQTMYPVPRANWKQGRERLEHLLGSHTWPWRVSKGIALLTADQ